MCEYLGIDNSVIILCVVCCIMHLAGAKPRPSYEPVSTVQSSVAVENKINRPGNGKSGVYKYKYNNYVFVDRNAGSPEREVCEYKSMVETPSMLECTCNRTPQMFDVGGSGC